VNVWQSGQSGQHEYRKSGDHGSMRDAKALKKELDEAQAELQALEEDLPTIKQLLNDARKKAMTARKKGVDGRVELQKRSIAMAAVYEQHQRDIAEQQATVNTTREAYEAQVALEARVAVFRRAREQVGDIHVALAQGLALVANAHRDYERIRGELGAGGVFQNYHGYTRLDPDLRAALPPEEHGIAVLDSQIHGVRNQAANVAQQLREANPGRDAVRYLDEAGL
jgi:hypothetical protein